MYHRARVHDDATIEALPAREREVLTLLAAGRGNAELVEARHLGEATVNTKARNIPSLCIQPRLP